MAERKQVDWEGVERDYSAGLLTLREIGEKYGISHTAIRKKAEKEDWSKDLSAKIAKEAEKKVSKLQVSNDVSKKASEKEIIEINAQALVNVKLKHRTSINRVNNLVDTLFEEIEELSTHKNADNLPIRVDMTKKLMDTLRISIDKERQAFDIKDNTTPIEGAINSLIGAIQGKSINVSSNLADLDDD
jgi:replicative superfamily II helicase